MIAKEIKIIVVIAGGAVFFGAFVLLDLGTFITFDLALDATSSGGKASDRGVDASTGHFKDKDKEQKGKALGKDKHDKVKDDKIKIKDSGDVVEIIDDRGTEVVILRAPPLVNTISDGFGGAPASTIEGGFQIISDEEAGAFPSIHTPARGQIVSAPILLKWKGDNPAIVDEVVFDRNIRDFITFQLPQTIFDTDRNLDDEGFWEGEFVYVVRLPDNFPNEVISPVRMLVDTGVFVQHVQTEVQFTEPQGLIKSFSLAEAIRSFLLLFRIGG